MNHKEDILNAEIADGHKLIKKFYTNGDAFATQCHEDMNDLNIVWAYAYQKLVETEFRLCSAIKLTPEGQATWFEFKEAAKEIKHSYGVFINYNNRHACFLELLKAIKLLNKHQ